MIQRIASCLEFLISSIKLNLLGSSDLTDSPGHVSHFLTGNKIMPYLMCWAKCIKQYCCLISVGHVIVMGLSKWE